MSTQSSHGIKKAPTGIEGLDAVTGGGLPIGRPTLIAGGPGCGKTLFAMTFLLEGAMRFAEPGVFANFEESADELARNVTSLGYDLDHLSKEGRIAVEHIRFGAGELEEAGEYDLEGLFIRLGHAIDSLKAKRVVLDTLEVLIAGLGNKALVRTELRRLFEWLKAKNVTAIITAERGEGALTRSGLEEYISDCVILLDQRVRDEIATRRLRIIKYRGSAHGTNEYPFIIDAEGISVFPVTSLELAHKVTSDRTPTGIDRLDAMLGGGGFYRGSSVLVSGVAGAGKSSFCATIAAAACGRGETCLYFTFEESPDQMIRNMRSLGLDLGRHQQSGLLRFYASRPTFQGLDTHLSLLHRAIERYRPSLVILDPISALANIGSEQEVHGMLLRSIDMLKTRGITALCSSLERRERAPSRLGALVSSLIDTWIVLDDVMENGESNRTILIRKSRGMAHSNQLREFVFSGAGIRLLDPYLGPDGAVRGSARIAQEARDAASALARRQDIERRRQELERKRSELEDQIEGLRRQFVSEQEELEAAIRQETARSEQAESDRQAMGVSRRADEASGAGKRGGNHG